MNIFKSFQLIAVSFCGIFIGISQPKYTVLADNVVAPIQPTMYGIFFEDINFAADGGLYAELVKNRSFEFTLPKMGWEEPNSDRFSLNKNSGFSAVMRHSKNYSNRNYLHVDVFNDEKYVLLNEGYRGIGIQAGNEYDFSFNAANVNGVGAIQVSLINPENNMVLASGKVKFDSHVNWKDYSVIIKANETLKKAQLKITFSGNGSVDLDMISLFPLNTWKGRKKGLRKDIVSLLADLQPGFLRFPGGCIVEGRTLERRYQWKKTVGPVENREYLVNRWNTEFGHRSTPDYYQSFGIGFYEYFLLAEDLGAAPLPILSCGMACQFNTGELVPMEELDPYIQDALDLIEFANGSVDTYWGKLRYSMGHKAPFNMKYIGIGNEQWGPEYIERLRAFQKAIKAKYPDIIIVSGSGPFPDGEQFDYAMEELAKLDVEIVDEHYYRTPDWFFENADRYDSYDRNGPKIFAGEYAAQSVAIASPKNQNNWITALSEAAFMTGLERNADIVHLTSYAPLLAHTEGWQWTPDLIWFDNLTSYGTPNYHVQRLFSTYRGSHLLSSNLDGKPAIGQNGIYMSTVADKTRKQIIIKAVNNKAYSQEINITVEGANVGKNVSGQILEHQNLECVNSIDQPFAITPKSISIKVNPKKISLKLPAQSFSVFVFEKQ